MVTNESLFKYQSEQFRTLVSKYYQMNQKLRTQSSLFSLHPSVSSEGSHSNRQLEIKLLMSGVWCLVRHSIVSLDRKDISIERGGYPEITVLGQIVRC